MKKAVKIANHRRDKLRAYSRRHREIQIDRGRCINEFSRAHDLPLTNPKTGKRYSKCEACRETCGIGIAKPS